MDRLFYIILVFLGCFVFFRVLFPLVAVIFIVYIFVSFVRALFKQNEPKEEYYEQTVHNPHQNNESDIIDVDYTIVEEE